MPDRVIRDELLKSDRWLDLPSDTHRLVYENLILIADDYGNIEGGPRRLYRWMHGFSQIKTEPDAIKLMSDLQDADMVRRYEVEHREYWHLTRFKNSRWYWKRSYPQSPYQDDMTNEDKQRPNEKRNTHVSNTLPTRREGVGVGEDINPTRVRANPVDKSQGQKLGWWETESGMLAKGKELGTEPRAGEGWIQFKDRLFQSLKSKANT